MQVVLLLDFVHGWNDKWVAYDEQFWCVYLSFLYPCNSSSLFAYLMLIFFFFFFFLYRFLPSLSSFPFLMQVHRVICCFTRLLCVDFLLLRTAFLLIHSFWAWLWAQHLLYCCDPYLCFCVCNSRAASCGEFLILLPCHKRKKRKEEKEKGNINFYCQLYKFVFYSFLMDE